MINLIKTYNKNLPETLAKWTIDYIDKNIIKNKIKEYDDIRRPDFESLYESIDWPCKILATNKWENNFRRAFDHSIKNYKKVYIRGWNSLYYDVCTFTIENFGGFKTQINPKKNNKTSYFITGLNNIKIVVQINYDRSC